MKAQANDFSSCFQRGSNLKTVLPSQIPITIQLLAGTSCHGSDYFS